MARRFEFVEGSSSKFWEVSVEGSTLTVVFGKIGTAGQTKPKDFASPEAAQKEADKLVSEKMDVTILSPIYLGTRQVNLREQRNVKTPADLKGVKLRMPGSKEWLFLGEALGATATPLAFGEVYMALKTGTIDGQDNPLPTVRAAKFYEVTKQLVLTNHLVDGIFIAISPFSALASMSSSFMNAMNGEVRAHCSIVAGVTSANGAPD